MQNYLIKDLNKNEKPREKLSNKGISALTDEELLALVISSGGKNISAVDLSREILKTHGGLHSLVNLDLESLTSIKHINNAKASSILAACEIGLRICSKKGGNLNRINSPQDVFDLIRKDIFQKDKEHLFLLSLNTRNMLLAKDLISIGTVNETLIHPREVFKKALVRNAVKIILVHNHPSNDPNPSDEDIKITEKVAKSGKQIGIPLIDHVIVCNNDYVSLKAQNIFDTYKFKSKGGERIESIT